MNKLGSEANARKCEKRKSPSKGLFYPFRREILVFILL